MKIYLYRDEDGDLWLCREHLGVKHKLFVACDGLHFQEIKRNERMDFEQVS